MVEIDIPDWAMPLYELGERSKKSIRSSGKQENVDRVLSQRPLSDWLVFAKKLGVEISSSGGIMIGPSDKFISQISPEDQKEIEEAGSFYGHFTGNPSAAENSDVTPEKIEQVHGKLNTLWKKYTGLSYDDWELVTDAIKDYLKRQPRPEISAERDLGIGDTHAATRKNPRQEMSDRQYQQAVKSLLEAVNG